MHIFLVSLYCFNHLFLDNKLFLANLKGIFPGIKKDKIHAKSLDLQRDTKIELSKGVFLQAYSNVC